MEEEGACCVNQRELDPVRLKNSSLEKRLDAVAVVELRSCSRAAACFYWFVAELEGL